MLLVAIIFMMVTETLFAFIHAFIPYEGYILSMGDVVTILGVALAWRTLYFHHYEQAFWLFFGTVFFMVFSHFPLLDTLTLLSKTHERVLAISLFLVLILFSASVLALKRRDMLIIFATALLLQTLEIGVITLYHPKALAALDFSSDITANVNMLLSVMIIAWFNFAIVDDSFKVLMRKNEELEALVAQRTQELDQANTRLSQKLSKVYKEKMEQEKLIHVNSRHAQMGEMIESILHQWRQPLSILSVVSSTLTLKNLEEDVSQEELQEALSEIEKQIAFMDTTAETFKNFFKPDERLRNFSPLKEIEKIMELVGRFYQDESIEISISGETTSTIYGEQNQFDQVILSLLANAKDAMKEQKNKKEISIKLFDTQQDVVIIFKDSGPGVDASVKGHIFDNHFTTKGEKGSGIGLSLSKAIVEKMQGRITLKECELGACFEMRFTKAKPQSQS